MAVSRQALASAKKEKKKKVSMPMNESLGYLAKSRYVRDLATLVVAYGISINLVEVTWKSKIKAQYPNPNDYSAFMGCVRASSLCLSTADELVLVQLVPA